ncbi:hypothetical protein [Sodalis sp.]
MGVEYIISERLFQQLFMKRFKFGTLIAPGLPASAERALMVK